MIRNRFGVTQCLLLIIAVCGITCQASASETTHNAAAMHLLRPGTAAVGDLDGDHIPDVASGIRTGHTSEGYSYRVDLDFTGNPDAKPFSVLSEDATGLNIEAVDIDGDHDLDLVITSRLSPRPIGVWLNDGRGRFTQGDLEGYVLSAWEKRPSVQSRDKAPIVFLHFEQRRPQISGDRQRVGFGVACSLIGELDSSCPGVSRISTGSARFRAPPIPSI